MLGKGGVRSVSVCCGYNVYDVDVLYAACVYISMVCVHVVVGMGTV